LLLPIPDLLNRAQDTFHFSLAEAERGFDGRSALVDVAEGFAAVERIKEELGLVAEDLLVVFTPATLESRGHWLTNLFAAGSNITEVPPRVAIISSAFMRRHILPRDPTYGAQGMPCATW
jgi:hypothetical protein